MSVQDIWVEFKAARSRARVQEDLAKILARKRDKSINPEEYVEFSRQCNEALRRQSDLTVEENALHGRLMQAMNQNLMDSSPI